MKTITSATPTMLATAPAWIESAPSSAPTVRSSRIVIGAGRAPARSSSARSLADCTVKLPEMMPLPPVIGSRITGALITLLSSTMANGLPTFWVVASANRRAPAPANDLDRLLDRLPPPRLGRDRAEPHRPGAVAGNLDRELGVELGQRLPRVLDPVADREDDCFAFDVEPGVADLGVAQRVAHVI